MHKPALGCYYKCMQWYNGTFNGYSQSVEIKRRLFHKLSSFIPDLILLLLPAHVVDLEKYSQTITIYFNHQISHLGNSPFPRTDSQLLNSRPNCYIHHGQLLYTPIDMEIMANFRALSSFQAGSREFLKLYRRSGKKIINLYDKE